jgi:hypothetical protein
MAYAPVVFAPRENVFPKTTSAPARAAKRGFWRRVLSALQKSRQRQADREIARYMHLHAGKMTDEIEREIERRFLHR